MPELEIIYRDDYLVAINKPANLLTHRSKVDKTETRFALQLLRDQLNRHVYPIHRLDKPTSGVLVFALAQDMARILSEQMHRQQMKKHYLALVRGYSDEQGIIDYALKEIPDKMTDAQAKKGKPAQSAITRYETLARVELPYPVGKYDTTRYSLLKLSPQTGRKHQLRRHLKHIHHPIIGDTRYGRGEHNRFFRTRFNIYRLLLHAYEMTLPHPVYAQVLSLRAGLDFECAIVIEQLGLVYKNDLTQSYFKLDSSNQ